ncbi:MAG: autophagy protein 6 [Claussenomyces sp. TS43310]|nr:MAG: autophagy protein 6 [Claussenomyces sp. TS43310]
MYCQKCRTPLKLDNSLSDLNPAAFNLLVGATATSVQQHSKASLSSRPAYPPERKALYDQVSKDSNYSSIKRNVGGTRHDGGRTSPEVSRSGPKDSQAMSFYMLSESEMVPPPGVKSPASEKTKSPLKESLPSSDGFPNEGKAMSHEIERVSRLFEILSARSDIDHPICVECTELLVDGLQKRLEATTRERDAYVGYLRQVTADRPTEEEVEESQRSLAKAQEEEAASVVELLRLEKEKAALDVEIAALNEEGRVLDLKEEEFWRSRNAFTMKLAEFQNSRDSINLKYDHDSQQLEKLQRTNVYNDTFCISHDGSFGTINGLRLGRLSSIPVDWPEINAAWGHTLLLLSTVADRLSFKFENYELQPMGSTSRIIKVDVPPVTSSRSAPSRRPAAPKRTILELYSSGDMPLGLTFMHRKFDLAMVAFLECMRQLGAFVEAETARGGRQIKLPYKIEGERIGDISIKLGIAQDDDWSKACKFTLTCCKFLLAHASNVNMAGRRGMQ